MSEYDDYQACVSSMIQHFHMMTGHKVSLSDVSWYVSDYQRLIAEQQSMIDSKQAYNTNLLNQAKQSAAATPELIAGLEVSLNNLLEIETRDQAKMIAFYTEAMKAYL